MHRHALSDREWNLLAPLLPQWAQTGRPPNDHRTIIDALLWLTKTGAPWRDLPELMSEGAVTRSGPGRPKLRPRTVIGDRGYTGKPSRDHLRRPPASRDQRCYPATQDGGRPGS